MSLNNTPIGRVPLGATPVGRRGRPPLSVLSRVVRSVAALTLVAAVGTVFISMTTAPAQAAPVSCGSGFVYGLDQTTNPHHIWSINTATGVLTSSTTVTSSANNLNGLAVDGVNNRFWMVEQTGNDQTGAPTILRVNPTTGATTSFTGTAITAPVTNGGVVMGALNPATGIYYYGVITSSVSPSQVHIYGFNTNTNTAIAGTIGRVSLGTGFNGDFAFDSAGRLYVISNGVVLSVDGAIPTTGTSVASSPLLARTVIATPPSGTNFGSLAFGGDGYLYGGSFTGSRQLYQINPSTGAFVATTTMTPTTNTIADFASCANPNPIRVQKDLPNGRYAAGDQFGLSVTGGGLSTGNTGTTTGTETGVQNQSRAEVAGPVLGLVGTTYSIAETPSGGTDLAAYAKTWQCVNTTNGDAVVASGTGATGSFTMPAGGAAGSDILCTFTNVAPDPSIRLQKVADTDELVVGDTITYTFTATNTGNVPLAGVVIDEDSFTGSGQMTPLSCSPAQPATLVPNGVMVCTADYVVSQDDVDAGVIANAATTTGTPPTGPPVTDDDDVTVPGDPQSALTLDKRVSSVSDVNGNGLTDAGDEILYEFEVTNTGNVTLSGVAVDDDLLAGAGITVTCDPSTLAPGASVVCTADEGYVITQADVDNGSVDNTATATGTPPTGPPVVTPPDDTTTPTDQDPSISLVKVADTNELVVGDTITYTFTATNTGNVTLDDVVIEEDSFTGSGAMGPLDCVPSQPATLAPDAVMVCTADYVVSQDDVDAGTINNAATATGTPPTGPPVSDDDDVTVPGDETPSMTLDKRVSSVSDVNGNGLTDAGDEILYEFEVTNTGNVTLTNLGVNDPLVGVVVCPVTTLAPNASAVCHAHAPYVITQDDVDAGSVHNTALAHGTPPTGPPVDSPPDSTDTPTDQRPSLVLDKRVSSVVDVNGNGRNDVGDKIFYTFEITNTGTVTVTDLTVLDDLLTDSGITVTCPRTTLAPGAGTVCRADDPYVITTADVDNRSVDNTATATATAPTGPPVETPPDEVTVTTPPTPPTPPVGPLPNTGANGILVPLSVGGLGLLLAGAWLARRSRPAEG